MKTIHLKTAIGADGLLKIETSTEYRNIAVEVVLVLHPVPSESHPTSQGYPPDFFERLDAIQSDDLLERPEQGIAETRETLE
jgi:hypothetical protein